ncbi:MAG: conjugative transfer signal peptidase TraF [Succinivibrio sp.]
MICVSLLMVIASITYSLLDLSINISNSIPRGLYKVKKHVYPDTGEYALFCLEGAPARIASERQYLTFGKCSYGLAPLGKQVAAREGDFVKISNEGVRVNEKLLKNSVPLYFDEKRNPMPQIEMEKFLLKNEYLMMSEKINSYDSRYYGVIKRRQIIGSLELIVSF